MAGWPFCSMRKCMRRTDSILFCLLVYLVGFGVGVGVGGGSGIGVCVCVCVCAHILHLGSS